MTRTLILLRHGKSDYPGGVTDHQRPLADRGRTESGIAGRLINEIVGDAKEFGVICSSATRTRQTLAATGLVKRAAWIVYTDAIYEASVPDVIAQIAGAADDVNFLLVVGHSPGMPATALTLADESIGSRDALDNLRLRFPTSAFAVLTGDGSWSELATAGAMSLQDFIIAR